MTTGSFSGGFSEGSNEGEFAKLFSSAELNFKPGAIVPGTVVEVGKDYVTIDIGFKSEGAVPIEQFIGTDGLYHVQPGDRVDVMIVTHENEFGQIVISKERADQMKVWKEIEKKYETGEMVMGRIVSKVKGGLQVDIGIPAFLPGSQIDMRPHRNLDKFLNQEYEFKILKITRDKGNIVLSRRAVLESERDELKTKTLEVLAEGVVMEGLVKNITEYGAFIDLGGVDGLLHITDISWGRVGHPSEKLSIGQKIPVVVLKYDSENHRVSLGVKQLKEDPWRSIADRYVVGQKVSAKVIGLADYGAFVELEEGVEGLIHVSDMSWTKKFKNPSKVVAQGESVECLILALDTEERKVSLGMKQTTANPWEQVAAKYPIRSKVKGKVRSITDFGIFIGVEDGIDGLVHVSDFSWTKRPKDPKEIQALFAKGQEVEAVVLEIDIENERLSLGIKQLEPDPWDTITQRYPTGTKVKGRITSVSDFGVFVEIENGIEGLVHLTQLGLDKKSDVKLKEVYEPGKEMECEITNIDPEERRISLSVKAIRRREEAEQLSQFMQDRESSPVTLGDMFGEQLYGGKKDE